MPPFRPTAPKTATPQGKKKTFEDDSDDVELSFDVASSSSSSEPRRSRSQMRKPRENEVKEDTDDDSDDAPEAVGLSTSKRNALRDVEEAKKYAMKPDFHEARQTDDRLAQSKKDASRLRNQKIAEARQKESTAVKNATSRSTAARKRKEQSDIGDEPEDEETRRLRARMEKAMDDGEGDSDLDGYSGDDLGANEGSSDVESFHTDTDDLDGEDDENEDEGDEDNDVVDDEDEDEGEGDSGDESETLEEGPIDNATRLMRERMQAAMEAAERRAGIVHPVKTSSSTKAAKNSSTQKSPSSKSDPAPPQPNTAAVDDVSTWDMSAGVGGPQPLSAEALRRAEEEAREARRQKKEKARRVAEKRKVEEKQEVQTKRRKVVESTSKHLGNGRVAKLLQPTLDPSAGGLPPVVDAGRKHKGQAAGQASQKKFIKHAMKFSGQIPNKAAVDARRKPVGLEARS